MRRGKPSGIQEDSQGGKYSSTHGNQVCVCASLFVSDARISFTGLLEGLSSTYNKVPVVLAVGTA